MPEKRLLLYLSLFKLNGLLETYCLLLINWTFILFASDSFCKKYDLNK